MMAKQILYIPDSLRKKSFVIFAPPTGFKPENAAPEWVRLRTFPDSLAFAVETAHPRWLVDTIRNEHSEFTPLYMVWNDDNARSLQPGFAISQESPQGTAL